MNTGLVSIAVAVLLLSGCSRHRDQRTAQTNRELTHIASLPLPAPAQQQSTTTPTSEAPTPENTVTRPSPFSEHPERELQKLPSSQPAPEAPQPAAVLPSSRVKTAAKPEEQRKALKAFVPKFADSSRDRLAPLPSPPALLSIPKSPAPGLNLGHKVCCVGTATFEPARPARLQRMLGKVPGLRKLHQNPDGVDGYVAPRPAREISLVLPPEASAALTRGTMDLKASVDETGHVTRVQLLAPKDEELVRLASYAAGAWPFVPAKVNDKAVPGEVILHFTFSGK